MCVCVCVTCNVLIEKLYTCTFTRMLAFLSFHMKHGGPPTLTLVN